MKGGKEMKTGLIVYLTGSDSLPETFDAMEAVARLTLPCDYSVPAAATEGYYGVQEAWHLLLTRGMQHIAVVKGKLDDAGDIKLFGEPLRLYG